MSAADVASASLEALWGGITRGVEPSRFRHVSPGVVAVSSGYPVAAMNGVWVTDPQVPGELITDLVGELARVGDPFTLQGRPGAGGALSEAARVHGLAPEEDVPLMVCEDVASLVRAAGHPDLVLAEGRSALAGVHAVVATAGFEAPEGMFDAMVGIIERAGLDATYVLGSCGGQDVVTALAMATEGNVAGIFNVATVPASRGRGYGAAATARAARAAGESALVWLQSSTMGHPVYERLGFRDVELWPTWESTAAGPSGVRAGVSA